MSFATDIRKANARLRELQKGGRGISFDSSRPTDRASQDTIGEGMFAFSKKKLTTTAVIAVGGYLLFRMLKRK